MYNECVRGKTTGPKIGRQGGPGGNECGRALNWRCLRTMMKKRHKTPARSAEKTVGVKAQSMNRGSSKCQLTESSTDAGREVDVVKDDIFISRLIGN